MESSSYGAPTPGDAPLQQPMDTIKLWKALDALMELGLSRDGIMSLSKLGVAGAHVLLGIFEQDGQEGVDGLLSPLEGVSEDTLGSWLNAIADQKSESRKGRRQSRHHSRGSIDNQNDATLLSTPATPHLAPPSFRRSSTRTGSASPAASTNITQDSSQKRRKTIPKSTRKQLYCPDCGTAIKNGFEKHFLKHLPYLFAQETLGENELIGCGYCTCSDPELDQGKAFQGVTALIRHIYAEHTQADSPAPKRLPWDFDSSFKNVLSGEVNIRRHFLSLVKEENRRIANKTPPYNVPPMLSWPHSPPTRQLLNELQTFGGSIYNVPFTHLHQADEFQLKGLLMRVYDAAHKWQPSSMQMMGALPQQLALAPVPAPAPSSQQSFQPPRQPSPYYAAEDPINFAAMGQGACDTSQYPSFKDDHTSRNPTTFKYETSIPQQFDYSYGNSEVGLVNSNETPRYMGNDLNPISNPEIQVPAQYSNPESFASILKALDVEESDLFAKYTNG